MKLLITGICGFAGSAIARQLLEEEPGVEIIGFDNLMRAGAETNRAALVSKRIKVIHGDLRNSEDLDSLPPVDWVLDAAANPSVLAGLEPGGSGSRRLMNHNLFGTLNMLEFCKARKAGFTLLSTSRVYSIDPLAKLDLEVHDGAFRPRAEQSFPVGISIRGVSEACSTAPPVSLYGATKVCSELLALEYGQTFGFPVCINRLGVLAGAGQFGRADQGIFSFWIHSCARKRPLKFIGFGGHGHQVRDCLHPRDVVSVLRKQFKSGGNGITNFSGGHENSLSLLQLHRWCEERFGKTQVVSESANRPFDVPWFVLDSTRARETFDWKPTTPWASILEEIACHAEQNPHWLDLTAG